MTNRVNYQTAKSLKEKGFDLPMEQNGRVYCEGTGQIDSIISSDQISNWNDKCYIEICSAPTIGDVVMWLYEKHQIWVEVNYLPNVDKFGYITKPLNFKKPKEFSSVKEYFKAANKFRSIDKYNSPTEAYQEAIKYTLENLI